MLFVLIIAFLLKNWRQEHMLAGSQPAVLCAFVEPAWNLFSKQTLFCNAFKAFLLVLSIGVFSTFFF